MPNRPTSDAPSVLFVPGAAPGASFVEADREVLTTRVRLLEVAVTPGMGQLALVRDLAAALVRDRPSRAVIWFAAPTYGAITAAICRAVGVPYLVVAGGMDVAACPDIGFGEARGGWRRAASRWVLERASWVWAFSAAAQAEIEARARPRTVSVVAPAVDTAFFRPPAGGARVRLVLSTCAALTRVTVAQKGIDRLIAAATRLPDVGFVVTGRIDRADRRVAALVAAAPANVSFAGLVSREALRALYARAAVVAQLSRHEGFGVAAVEAAAMGCRLLTTPLPVFDEVLGPDRTVVAADASDDDVAAAVVAALAAPAPAPDRAEALDRRYGVRVRAAAWDRWLRAEGLLEGRA